MIPSTKAEAAGVPYLIARKAQYTGERGTTSTACEYDVTACFHKYEKIIIEVYDSNGTKVSNLGKSQSLYWTKKELEAGAKKDTIIYSLYVSSGFAPGTTFTIKAKFQYSDDGKTYVDAPNEQVTTFVIQAKASDHINEWYKGHWYDEKGNTSYTGVLTWHGSGSNWFVMDTKGWYPKSQWLKIDGNWYYFTASGYMDYSEYRDGCWLNADGTCSTTYTHGTWHQDSNGWWYEDNGWYPTNQYLWIDGTQYWFNGSGYAS
jgi:hypothetical protein